MARNPTELVVCRLPSGIEIVESLANCNADQGTVVSKPTNQTTPSSGVTNELFFCESPSGHDYLATCAEANKDGATVLARADGRTRSQTLPT